MSKGKHEPHHATEHTDTQRGTEHTDTQRDTEHTTMGAGDTVPTLKEAVQAGPPIINLSELHSVGGELKALAYDIRRHIPIHLLDAVNPFLVRVEAIGDSLLPPPISTDI